MKKSSAVVLQLVSAVAAMALSVGCGSQPTHQKVCADASGNAVEPEKCEQEDTRRAQTVQGGSHHHHTYVPLYNWYYGPYSAPVSPGQRLPVSGFTTSAPTGKGVSVSSPSRSSSVRGGFGSSARPSGGSSFGG